MHSSNKPFNFGSYVSNDQALNKRIPGNPKYQHVKPAVNSGSTVQKQIDELREKQKNCLHKKDEVFNRIKFSSFIELLVEAAKVKLKLEKEKSQDGSNIEGSVKSSDNKHPDKVLPNVIMGIGEIDLANQKRNPSSTVHKLEKELPYLLLDVRDKEQFVQNNIKTARHYPSALLARSVGFETEEMKLYKNSSPEIIIVYDDDESIAVRVATTLVQRGYDNVFVLTGGLKHCLQVFPKKPLSHLCTNQPSQSGSPAVVVKNGFSELSQEDIDVIEQYLDYPKHEQSK
ncbi:centrosomal protein of 41 kDa B isoform X2 [Parasteatoda tepidariorum]|uniref:centrosomal protein of 41 kDa B isoform X2 n=1 Tax=Parasteatoda tepidariorum TaxID=114398 RepID=UPI00077FE098|nr:centrosomal protein of 41 kDa B isoform X2 [Parasteatoda tepidariorum]